jgi:hypothetical protein
MSDKFFQGFISRFKKIKREEGWSEDDITDELIVVLSKMSEVDPKLETFSRKYVSLVLEEQMQRRKGLLAFDKIVSSALGETMSYVTLIQEFKEGSRDSFQVNLFGPFTESVWKWKMHLMYSRLKNFSQAKVRFDSDLTTCKIEGSDNSSIGFMVMPIKEVPELDARQAEQGIRLRDWDDYLFDEVYNGLPVDDIANCLGGLIFE